MCCMAGCSTVHGWCDNFTDATSSLPASGAPCCRCLTGHAIAWHCRSRLLTERLYVVQAALHTKGRIYGWPVALFWLRLQLQQCMSASLAGH